MVQPKTIICILLTESSDSILKLADACLRFTPEISLGRKNTLFLDVTKSLSIYSPSNLRARILLISSKLNIPIKMGFSRHPCVSLAKIYFPLFNESEHLFHLPIEALFCFLNPFSSDHADKKAVVLMIQRMKFLGLKTLEEVSLIPRKEFISRFGALGQQIFSFLKEESDPPWTRYTPPVLIEEEIQLDDEQMEGTEVTLEPLLFILKTLLDRAFIRLRGRNERASKVLVSLKVSNWSTVKDPDRTWIITLPIPQGSSLAVLPILREKLFFELNQSPLSAPARYLLFSILETVPGNGLQKNFFNQSEIESEQKDQLLGRLLSKLGEPAVFYAGLTERYQPEKAWLKLSPYTDKKNSYFSYLKTESAMPFLFRPTRILTEPEVLFFKPSFLIHGKTKQNWKIQNWEGPERIFTEWWKPASQETIHRDYYRVRTFDHRSLWVFFDLKLETRSLFLHGFFD